MSNLQPLEFKECVIDSPWFREKLLLHEKEIDNSVKVFKDIYNSIKNVYKTLEDCSMAFKELADNLKKFTTSGDTNLSGKTNTNAETEDEKMIRSAVEMYSDLISNIEAMRREHILGATKDVIMEDLQKLREDCLYRSQQDIKEFKKTTANYYIKLDKYSAMKYKNETEYENVDAVFQAERHQYVTKALTHVMNIQETEEQKTCKLVHTLSLLIQMLNTYHHQAWDHFGDQKKKIDEINCALYRNEESYISIKTNTERLKQQILSLPIEHIQPDSKVEGAARREGYLFVLTKKSLMSDIWTRKFCVYEKNFKKFILTQVSQASPTSPFKMQSEEYQLISCSRKLSNNVDRRFSFDVKINNQHATLTLQALTKEDLTQWMQIMDGKEPMYALPCNSGSIKEPETVLNEKVLRFLGLCFAEIERRGIDTQGVYRTPGRASQRDSLLKRIIVDVGNSSSDIMSSRELETLEINTICSIVKTYIKYLRVPMATYILYDEFISAGKLQNSDDKFNALITVVRKLPPDHLQLFSLVMKHLSKVTMYQERNLMTAPNLGVCFSPTIFRPKQGNASLAAIRESKFAADVITMLIERCHDIFPQSPYYQNTSLTLPKITSVDLNMNEERPRISPQMNRSYLECQNSKNNSPSPNLGLRRHQTDISSPEVNSNVLKPSNVGTKQNLAKLSPQLQVRTSIKKSDSGRYIHSGNNNLKRSSVKAKTLYMFVAENDCQLSFDSNKIVTNVSESEDIGWFVGNIDGKIGLIPKSYVELLPS